MRPVYLSGMMGTGKSTVGRLVAARLGRPFVDLDAEVEEEAGRPIAAIVARQGEQAFRRLEGERVAALVEREDAPVVALGGGTVAHEESRARLRRSGTLLTLTAPPRVLAARIGADRARPLLARADGHPMTDDERAATLARLARERQDAYEEAHGVIDVDRRSPDEVADAVLAVVRSAPVLVPLGRRSYRVLVGRGVRAEVERAIAHWSSALVVTDANVAEPWARPLARALGAPVEILPPGEAHKTIATVDRIWRAALASGVDRAGGLVAVGGGVVGDMTGFAASTLHRGVASVQVPTTVLAMADASVGGKTGVDRPEGKNLVGSVHQPEAVLADLDTLTTLPAEERRSGLAEVVKAAWIEGEDAVAALEGAAPALAAGEPEALGPAVRRAVALKAEVVAEDEREGGRRRVLNLGHTVAHALEAASGYALRHGEAVALGLVAAFQVAEALGDAGASAQRRRLSALLDALGLPTDVAGRLTPDVLDRFGADKKRVGTTLHAVVPGRPGEVTVTSLEVGALRRMLAG
ncbi:MAG: 3-dehydroquinate synthase [Sandaracinaceae bacterium]